MNCPRCGKDTHGGYAHTCKPTEGWRKMETEIADLKRQLEEVKSESRDACIGLNDYFGKQLAESQAREFIRREALLQMKEYAESYGKAWARAYVNEYRDLLPGSAKEQFDLLAVMHRRLDKVGEAIDLPHDDTALREYHDSIVEKCAVTAGNSCLVLPDGGSPTAEEAAVSEEAARRIRNLKCKP